MINWKAVLKLVLYRGSCFGISWGLALILLQETAGTSAAISLADNLTSIVAFYIHEIIWERFKELQGAWRYASKAVTWRIVGFTISVLAAWIITGDLAGSGMYAIAINILATFAYIIVDIIGDKVFKEA